MKGGLNGWVGKWIGNRWIDGGRVSPHRRRLRQVE